MLQIVAVLSLTLGQAERPPKLDFKTKIDYAAWINAQTPKGKGENAMDRYAGFAPKRDGKGGMTEGMPSIDGAAREQMDAIDGIWTPSEHPDLAKYIEDNSKFLDALIHATEAKDFWDTIEPGTAAITHLMPYLSPSRIGCRVLLARAWMKQPRQVKAIENAHRVVFGARRHVQQTGFLIAALVGVAEGTQAYWSVRRAVDAKVVGEKDCARWYQLIQSEDPGTPAWDMSMRIEWATTLGSVQLVCPEGKHVQENWKRGYEMISVKPFTPQEFAQLSRSDPRECVELLDSYFASLIAIGKGPLRGSKIGEMRKIREEWSATAKAKSNYMATFFTPGVNQVYELLVRCETERRGTLLTLAIHAHHAKHGTWPEDLGKIDAKLGLTNLKAYRIDPYTGKRFIYRLKDGKPWLYSAGADGNDDGGKHDPKFGENSGGGDYVFWPPPTKN